MILPLFLLSAVASAQGVAIPKTQARPSPLVKGNIVPAAIRYEDIAVSAGLDFRHVSGDPVRKTYLVEATGSGVALFDYDGDGLLDIFLVNGTSWSAAAMTPSRLYHNEGNLRFRDVTRQSGIDRSGWGQGVCAGDFNNDGHPDLYVTYWGQNVLYRNRGDGTFEDVTVPAGLRAQSRKWGTGCAFFDYDRDGLLDLATTSYAELNPGVTPKPGSGPLCMHKGLPVMCGPRGLSGGGNQLYRNLGGGRFADVTVKAGFHKPSGYYGFAVLTADFDNDGWVDVYVACDSTPSVLYRNKRDGTFADIGVSSGTAFNENGEEQAGMGAAAGDFNRDGWLDIVKTNFAGDTPTLYENDGKAFFTDVTARAGLAVETRFLGWGALFADVDNDGWKDIFLANGHVYPNVDSLRDSSPYHQERNLYWNLRNGAFAAISQGAGPGVTTRHSSRGTAVGDLDNDGRLEIVIQNIDAAPSLLVNRARAAGHWISLRLRGTNSSRDAAGARVEVMVGEARLVDEVRSGGSYLSQSDFRLHFGLGDAPRYDAILVRWPTGAQERFGGGEAGRLIDLVEGAGVPVVP